MTVLVSCHYAFHSARSPDSVTHHADDDYILLRPFNGLFSRKTWVSRYRKGKSSLDLNEVRDYGVLGCSGVSWTICKQPAPRSRQTTTPAPHHSIFTGRMLFPTPNQQCRQPRRQVNYLVCPSTVRDLGEKRSACVTVRTSLRRSWPLRSAYRSRRGVCSCSLQTRADPRNPAAQTDLRSIAQQLPYERTNPVNSSLSTLT